MGGGRTRRGVIVRADLLSRLTPLGEQQLLDYGVTTIIDLRSPQEVAEEPPANFKAGEQAPIYKNLAVVDRLEQVDAAMGQSQTWTDMYKIFLDDYQDSYAPIMRAIVASPPGAVVIHCHAGKDRTGVVAALLLSLAGVEKEAIAADYALSQENLWPLYEQMAAEAGGEENISRWWKPDTAPETMLATLAHLHDQYGGAETYLLDAGLKAKEIERLRKLFIC